MSIFRNLAVAGAVSIAALAVSVPAQATVWTIDAVLSGNDGGFVASGFHTPNPGDVMRGSNLGSITGSTNAGFFNDVTGVFSGAFSFGSVNFTLSSSNLKFNSSSNWALLNDASMALTVLNGSIVNAANFDIGFMQGLICCGDADNRPNSFEIINGTTAILALWGADGFNGGTSYSGSTLGMDLRLHLSLGDNQNLGEVPIPASLPLFGTGLALMGYLGWRKKKRNA